MQLTRREFGIAAVSSLAAACGASNPITGPSTFKLEPLVQVVSPENNTAAVIRHHGYGTANQSLFQAMREAGLNPRLRITGDYGKGTWEVSDALFGWVFCVQNTPLILGVDDNRPIILRNNDLWAAYEKLTVG